MAAEPVDTDWDGYWASLEIPTEATYRPNDKHGNSILDMFRMYVPSGIDRTAAELGGAPGHYLAFVQKALGYSITCIDNSAVGCAKARQNFLALGIDATVLEADIFDPSLAPARYDFVYSLGLIEHFADRDRVVAAHLRFVKPGGTLLLGVPNLQGIQGRLFRRLRPKSYATHILSTMDLRRWGEFERRHDLLVIFKGYVGGFEPAIALPPEDLGIDARLLAYATRALVWLVRNPLRFVRRWDGRHISSYALAIYKVPALG